MSRCPSEWYLEKFLEEAAACSAPSPNPSLNANQNNCNMTPDPPSAVSSASNPDAGPNLAPDPSASSSTAGSNFCGPQRASGRVGNGEVVEIKDPFGPPAAVDPRNYQALLKQKLDMICAAVAISRVMDLVEFQLYPFCRTQVSELKIENSALLKRLTDINQKYGDAAVGNRILKADVETLRAKVKMAEETVKRVTGVCPLYPIISDMSNISLPFNGSSCDATSNIVIPVQDDTNHFFHVSAYDQRTNSRLPDIGIPPPVEDAVHGAVAAGETARAASMQQADSLEHPHKRILGGLNSSLQWDSAAWDPKTSVTGKKNQG
ncbi:hypothetical protein BHE74_00003029 [Ensete ventricosum]|nr:hypothetical protein BHE74_00003029 [Ensete ventricosum]